VVGGSRGGSAGASRPHTLRTACGAGRRPPRRAARCECYLVPVDICYELVGRMRLLWQGFDGGAEARAALDTFFEHVGRRARPVREEGPA
ncbi:DUF5947 family protein, partial [Streptomyces sp. NPDC127044]